MPASLQAADTKSAVLPSPGGVWINGMEAADTVGGFSRATYWKPSPASRPASARTAPRFSFQPESVVRFADNLLVLDHGNLLVGTMTGMRVRVHCITVIPVSDTEWTQYEVTDVNGNIEVAAHKKDVRIELEGNQAKTPSVTQATGGTTVHHGEQASRRESEACGAPLNPASALKPLILNWW